MSSAGRAGLFHWTVDASTLVSFPVSSCNSSEVDLVNTVWKAWSGSHHSGAQLVRRAVRLIRVQKALMALSIIAHLQVYLSPLPFQSSQERNHVFCHIWEGWKALEKGSSFFSKSSCCQPCLSSCFWCQDSWTSEGFFGINWVDA